MNRGHWWRHSRERLFAWLPALLMAAFALATGWLVRSMPDFGLPAQERPLLHEPDYQMRRFSLRSFDAEGRFKSEIQGVEGQHFPDTDTLEVRQPRMRAVDEQGQVTVGRAERGIANGDGSEIRLYEQARVVREAPSGAGSRASPRLEFRGDYLYAQTRLRRVSSDQPVELLRGSDRFTANAFDYDDRERVANLRGQVRGVIQSRVR